MPSAEKHKQILKAKEIIGLKRMPGKSLPAEWYLYKDACQTQKHPEEYLLSPPPIHQFGLAGSLRLSTEATQCTWFLKSPQRSLLMKAVHFVLFLSYVLPWDAEPYHWPLLPQRNWDAKIWTESCSCALWACKAPYFRCPCHKSSSIFRHQQMEQFLNDVHFLQW